MMLKQAGILLLLMLMHPSGREREREREQASRQEGDRQTRKTMNLRRDTIRLQSTRLVGSGSAGAAFSLSRSTQASSRSTASPSPRLFSSSLLSPSLQDFFLSLPFPASLPPSILPSFHSSVIIILFHSFILPPLTVVCLSFSFSQTHSHSHSLHYTNTLTFTDGRTSLARILQSLSAGIFLLSVPSLTSGHVCSQEDEEEDEEEVRRIYLASVVVVGTVV